ncbi:PilZ domain-containing protein [Thalassotalea psychrophila]|uniref:PilZ domain-containing protein n=1 Tax=Thalassotalea psychrophila TaxID=3065647 RepID=A0ABY9TPK6_9GAMM|nr:PilZ domain-containing protein [Colwelliaceae bacterium SQ149]
MHKFDQDFDESRSMFRTMVNQQITITLLDEETNIDVMVNCRDISTTGIALEIEHPVEVGTIIKFHHECDEQLSAPLTDCKGRVLRCEQESNDLFLLAIEIVDNE